MSRRRIRFSLFDPQSVADALSQIEKARDDIPNYAGAVLNQLAYIGEQYAQNRVMAYDAIDTGNLQSSIHAEGLRPDERISKVVADAWYAAYVEYGTGIVGAGQSHPQPDGWAYDINGHGDMGWNYYDQVHEKWRWTRGMAARPFMYETKLYLEQQAPKITAKVFRSL